MPFKKIHNFNDAEFSKAVHESAKTNPLGEKHSEIFRRSKLFQNRRCFGIEDDPTEFFDTSKPYFLLRKLKHLGSDFKFTNENASIEKVGVNEDNKKKTSDCESVTDSDEESGPSTKFLPELHVENSPYDDEMIEKILSCIKAGHVNKHLIDVANSKIACKKHDLYVEAMKTCNIELLSNSPSYIPINNRKKLNDVSIHLYNLYQREFGKGKPKMEEYVVSVWLPEAVEKAISFIKADTGANSNPLSFTLTEDENSEAEVQSSHLHHLPTGTNIVSVLNMLSSSAGNKKKCIGSKRQKGRCETMMSPKKKLAVLKMNQPEKGDCVISTEAANISESEASN